MWRYEFEKILGNLSKAIIDALLKLIAPDLCSEDGRKYATME